MGFGVQGLGSRVWGLGFGVFNNACTPRHSHGPAYHGQLLPAAWRVQGGPEERLLGFIGFIAFIGFIGFIGFGDWGLGFRVLGLGFGVVKP